MANSGVIKAPGLRSQLLAELRVSDIYQGVGPLRQVAGRVAPEEGVGHAQQAVEDGLVAGPRVQLSLVMLSQTGGHGDDWLPSGDMIHFFPPHAGLPDSIVDGPDEMRRKVRELQRMGAEVVKVATSGGVLSPRDDPRHAHFRPDELAVLVEEATAAGMFVMAHAQGADGIKNAAEALEKALAPREVQLVIPEIREEQPIPDATTISFLLIPRVSMARSIPLSTVPWPHPGHHMWGKNRSRI